MAGTLRITGGRLVRRQFEVPEEADRGQVRPTSDRVREALFSALATALDSGLEGALVLDAFAGSGALGFEALSRGAGHVTFLERHRRVAKTLESNLKALGLSDSAEVIVDDAARALARFEAGAFDLVLVDPPYQQDLQPFLQTLAALPKVGGLLVIERDKKARDLPPPGLSLVRDKVYGQTRVTMWRR